MQWLRRPGIGHFHEAVLLADCIYNLISVAISLKQLPVHDCDSLTSELQSVPSVQFALVHWCYNTVSIQCKTSLIPALAVSPTCCCTRVRVYL